MKEAATHNEKRDEVGEHKVGQVVTEGKNASSYLHMIIIFCRIYKQSKQLICINVKKVLVIGLNWKDQLPINANAYQIDKIKF